MFHSTLRHSTPNVCFFCHHVSRTYIVTLTLKHVLKKCSKDFTSNQSSVLNTGWPQHQYVMIPGSEEKYKRKKKRKSKTPLQHCIMPVVSFNTSSKENVSENTLCDSFYDNQTCLWIKWLYNYNEAFQNFILTWKVYMCKLVFLSGMKLIYNVKGLFWSQDLHYSWRRTARQFNI